MSLAPDSQNRYILEADDGEKEISFCVPSSDHFRFSYNLWRSTKGAGKGGGVAGFELSQFVMMQQKDGRFKCKVSKLSS